MERTETVSQAPSPLPVQAMSMMKTATAAITAGVFGSLLAGAASAHHSPAAFDRSHEVRIEGTLTRVTYSNPHIYLSVEIIGPAGVPIAQEVEVGPISTIQPLGLMSDSLRVGEHVVVRANPSRRGAGYTVLGLDVTRADGKTFPLNIMSASARPASTAVATSLAGTWRPTLKGFEALAVAIGSSWPLTEEGTLSLAKARQANRTPQADCIPAGAPMLMVYPVATSLEIGDATVVFDIDWLGARRIVHLDVASHPSELQPTLQGHSIGRWESMTLVVETVGFARHAEGLGFAMPSSEGKRLVERFTLGADRRHLIYDVIVEDSRYLARPVQFQATWDYSPHLRPSGVSCDVEVARRYLHETDGHAQPAAGSAEAASVLPPRAPMVASLAVVLVVFAALVGLSVRRRAPPKR
jgi:hypothetical protein